MSISDSESDGFGNFSDASIDDDINIDRLKVSGNSNVHTEETRRNKEAILQSTIDTLFNETGQSSIDSKVKFLEDKEECDIQTLLNFRARIIYEQLVCLPFENNPITPWNKSYVRELLFKTLNIDPHSSQLATLQIPTERLETQLFGSIIETINGKFTGYVQHCKENEENATEDSLNEFVQSLITNISEICGNPEILELAKELIIIKLNQLVLLRDKQTYEDIIKNLVGHTQRIRRDEIEEYNKKHKRKYKVKSSSWKF